MILITSYARKQFGKYRKQLSLESTAVQMLIHHQKNQQPQQVPKNETNELFFTSIVLILCILTIVHSHLDPVVVAVCEYV